MAPKPTRRRFFTALAGTALLSSAQAARERCAVCNRRLPREHFIYDNLHCCSERCADQLRPNCSICRKRVGSNYFQLEGKIFCGKNCFQQTLPKCDACHGPIEQGYTIARHQYCKSCVDDNPTCFSCGLPAPHHVVLADNRKICNHCRRWAVKTQEMAERHYARARRQIEAWTGLKIASLPELQLVDRYEMQELSKKLRKSDSPVSIRGLYSRQVTRRGSRMFGIWREEPVDTSERIYIVDHLHDEVFRVAATHELMHDLIHEHFPHLTDAPLWVQEGLCQQAAAELCRRRNYLDVLHGIENCDDPDYGDGYRYMKKVTGFNGWRSLSRWMREVDVASLPRKAPRQQQ